VELRQRALVLVADIVLRREVYRIALAVVVMGPGDAVFSILPESTELQRVRIILIREKYVVKACIPEN
jgi:hypothetical protein